MNHLVVEKYIEEKIGNRLKEFKIGEDIVNKVKESIRENMYSLIFHWNDIEFRNAILITSMEEAKFYEPDADIDIKCFVVVTIRNSLLEDIFCDDCCKIGLEKPIDEKEIKTITKEAIEYFKDVNFSNISKEINLIEEKDKYLNIAKKYPMALKALIELGKCTGKRSIYDKIIIEEKIQIKDIVSNKDELKENNIKEVQSGITEELSTQLIKILECIAKGQIDVFYVDCFKMLTRNFDKLLKVLEIVLENEGCFLTSNYMITDTYIGKRSNIYRAAHTIKEMKEKMKDSEFFSDVSKSQKIFLKSYVDSYFLN